MKNKKNIAFLMAIVSCLTIVLLAMPVLALQPENQPPTKVSDAIWYNGDLYGTILLGDIKNPNPKSLDALYNFGDSGLMGQRSISEAAPGNPEYNGGRWMVFAVTFTELGLSIHDPDGDGVANFELMSVAALMTHESLGHLTISEEPVRYFICPMQKNR